MSESASASSAQSKGDDPMTSSAQTGGQTKIKNKNAPKDAMDAVDELASDNEGSGDAQKENTPGSSSRRKNDSPQTRQGTKRRKVESPQKAKIPSPRTVAANPASRLSVNVPAPVGFLAGRESRAAARGKDDRGYDNQPSPVVMGFDIGSADPQQIETVRNTLRLKQQQEALIAQRRRDGLTTPVTAAGEHGWPNWKEQEEEATAKRQAQVKAEGEKLSIVPASFNAPGIERDAGSKSAPLNHSSMAQQQRTPREAPPPNPPQTSHPTSSSRHQQEGPAKATVERPLRTAHPSTSNMQHQQQQQDYAWEQRQREKERDRERERDHRERDRDFQHQPLLVHRPSSTGQHDRQHDRRIVSVPTLAPRNGHDVRPGPGAYHLPEPNVHNGPPSARSAFLAPFAQVYDSMHETRHLRGQMLELISRGEEHMLRQDKVGIEMADHYRRSVHLLNTLQESSSSLQEMVKREVATVRADYEEEIKGWRRRCEELSERLADKAQSN